MTDSLSPGVRGDGTGQDPDDGAAGGRGGPETLVVRGVVRDSLGVALPRAVVTLAAGGRPLGRTRSAADGGFLVTAPGPGSYELTAYSPQLGEQSVAVNLDGHSVAVEFRIDVPGTVAG
ncbi:hypothetical protein GCM10009716_15530 [Streptomyces sodiiphilus]|uniref:Carboxypeptidase regulatory-like domain-containing protein n=1 Tax=Streptomyces sodiiphilus TaxID=226217 RepID=A0ABP5A9I8_9ACTN